MARVDATVERLPEDKVRLSVEVSDELDVRLTGTASPVYAGELSPELVRALEEI